MALQRSKIQDTSALGSSVASVVTNASGEKVYIRGFTLFNGNSGDELVKLYNVPNSGGSAGTAGATNQVFEYGMESKETYTHTFPGGGIVLSEAGDSLQGLATVAGLVTITLHGDRDA